MEMNIVGACILIVLMAVVLLGSRRWATLGMMAGVLYLTQGQKIEMFGLDLFAGRFLEMAGFARVMARREFSFSRRNSIDWALVVFYGYATIVFLLRSTVGLAYQIGLAVDASLCYFTFRGLIKDIDDLRWFLRSFILLLGPYTILVLVERLTGYNAFAFMGGIKGGLVREGRMRCWGSFRHPVLLGTFGASFLPLYIGLFFDKESRTRAVIGSVLCLGIVLASNSGGPLSSMAAALVGWLFWKVRFRMRSVRYGIAGTVALLAILMKAPVWYFLARVSSITGGEGYHRAYLIDIAVQNIGRWWLAGMPLAETHEWFPYTSPFAEGADVTNAFIFVGLNAGLGALGLFIFLLVRAFSRLGKALMAVRGDLPGRDRTEFLLWGMGVTLLVHVVSWIGVTYFDQMYVVWFMHLAAISSVSQTSLGALTKGAPFGAATNET